MDSVSADGASIVEAISVILPWFGKQHSVIRAAADLTMESVLLLMAHTINATKGSAQGTMSRALSRQMTLRLLFPSTVSSRSKEYEPLMLQPVEGAEAILSSAASDPVLSAEIFAEVSKKATSVSGYALMVFLCALPLPDGAASANKRKGGTDGESINEKADRAAEGLKTMFLSSDKGIPLWLVPLCLRCLRRSFVTSLFSLPPSMEAVDALGAALEASWHDSIVGCEPSKSLEAISSLASSLPFQSLPSLRCLAKGLSNLLRKAQERDGARKKRIQSGVKLSVSPVMDALQQCLEMVRQRIARLQTVKATRQSTLNDDVDATDIVAKERESIMIRDEEASLDKRKTESEGQTPAASNVVHKPTEFRRRPTREVLETIMAKREKEGSKGHLDVLLRAKVFYKVWFEDELLPALRQICNSGNRSATAFIDELEKVGILTQGWNASTAASLDVQAEIRHFESSLLASIGGDGDGEREVDAFRQRLQVAFLPAIVEGRMDLITVPFVHSFAVLLHFFGLQETVSGAANKMRNEQIMKRLHDAWAEVLGELGADKRRSLVQALSTLPETTDSAVCLKAGELLISCLESPVSRTEGRAHREER